jgi:hypothetical protein
MLKVQVPDLISKVTGLRKKIYNFFLTNANINVRFYILGPERRSYSSRFNFEGKTSKLLIFFFNKRTNIRFLFFLGLRRRSTALDITGN